LIGALVYTIGDYSSQYHELKDFYDNGFWYNKEFKYPIMYCVCILIIIPLCLLKDISKMRFSSTLGVITISALALIIIFQFPWYFSHYLKELYKPDDPKTHINIFDISKGFDKDLYFFTGSSTLFYAYSCHIAAFPIYKSLKNRNIRRARKVFSRSIMLDGFLYMLIGVCGYLSTPIETPDLIIDRYQYFDTDIIMLIGKSAFILALCAKIPANYNSFRLSVLALLFDNTEVTNKRYVSII
jgi:amino acid permease